MGSLSKKYESGSSGPGTIANNRGDWGGASYGTYQIATNTGTMNSFLNHLKRTNPSMYGVLSSHKPGTSGFNSAWKSLANRDPNGFNAVQHSFIKSSHYDPVHARVQREMGISVDKRSPALQNVLWSIAVQHGAGGATNIFKRAGITNGMSDEAIIRKLYAERSANNGMKYFPRSSSSIRKSVMGRFTRELQDALNMLA